MSMLFSPRKYETIEELRSAHIIDAHSDMTYQGHDVFGFVDGVAYAAEYRWEDRFDADGFGETFQLCIAGDPIFEVEMI